MASRALYIPNLINQVQVVLKSLDGEIFQYSKTLYLVTIQTTEKIAKIESQVFL